MGSQATKVQAPPGWKRQFGEQQAEIYASEISQIATNLAEMRELMGRITVIGTGGISDVTWDAEIILALAPAGTALWALLARRAALGATEGTAAAVGKEALAGAGTAAEAEKIAQLSGIGTILKSAQAPYKGSTVAGHALSKHAGRKPEVWGKTTGSMATWNKQAMVHLREIARARGEFKQITTEKGLGFWRKDYLMAAASG